jgi:hypothetical protein
MEGHHTTGWISLQKTLYSLIGIIHGTDAESMNPHPKVINLIIVL